MTRDAKVLKKLSEWQPAHGRRQLTVAEDAGWTISFTLERRDELSCLLWEVSVQRKPAAESLRTWADRLVWNRKAGLYHTLHDAALDDERLLSHLEHLAEQLKELATLTLVDEDGEVITPARGRIGYGDYDTTDDIHTMEDTF